MGEGERAVETKRRTNTGKGRPSVQRDAVKKKGTGREGFGPKERRRLLQLAGCILIFLAAYFGKAFLPWEEGALGEMVTAVISQDIDFKGTFSELGYAVSSGRSISETLGELYVNVFRPEEAESKPVSMTGYFASELNFMAGGQKNLKTIAERRLSIAPKEPKQSATKPASAAAEGQEDPEETDQAKGADPANETTAPSPTPTAVPKASPTAKASPAPTQTGKSTSPKGIDQIKYTGEALPVNTSMEKRKLSFTYTTPVMGVISSGFGYRVHPVDGQTKFHYGADIAAEEGTPIKSFADGTVDYIGESAIYGFYTRISHADHTTSFYAHCSKLLVTKGQKVKKGDVIAKVGATGNATGPHLHLEIRKNGVFLNPLYYIDRIV